MHTTRNSQADVHFLPKDFCIGLYSQIVSFLQLQTTIPRILFSLIIYLSDSCQDVKTATFGILTQDFT